MEKLQEFNKTNWDCKTNMYRFQCDCLSASDAMDVSVDSYGEDDEGKFIILTLDFKGNSFLSRIKYAWQIIRGHWAWREFVVREEDFGSLSEIFNPDKKYSELP